MQRGILWVGGAAGTVIAAALFLLGARFTSRPAATTTSQRTITVMGNGLGSSSTTGVNQISINLSTAGHQSLSSSLAALNSEIQAVTQAATKLGVPASAISQNNQGFFWNNQGVPGKFAGGANANDNVMITVPAQNTQSVFLAVVNALSAFTHHSGNGNDNVYVSPQSQSQPPNASTSGIDAALSAATREATAIAARMGVGLGPIQSVTQEPYTGYQNGNQSAVTLKVVFTTRAG